MSVYIKGFVIPENCDECPVCDYEQGECLVSNGKFVLYEERLKRQPWCPLIPVKDCGDLIDRDRLRQAMFIGEQCLYSWDEIEDCINFAPTIIPASDKDINVPSKEKVEKHE